VLFRDDLAAVQDPARRDEVLERIQATAAQLEEDNRLAKAAGELAA